MNFQKYVRWPGFLEMTPINFTYCESDSPSNCSGNYKYFGYKSYQISTHTLSAVVFIRSVFTSYSCYTLCPYTFDTALYYLHEFFLNDPPPLQCSLPNLKTTPQNQSWFWKWPHRPPPLPNKMASTNPNPPSKVINDQPLYDVSWFNNIN